MILVIGAGTFTRIATSTMRQTRRGPETMIYKANGLEVEQEQEQDRSRSRGRWQPPEKRRATRRLHISLPS